MYLLRTFNVTSRWVCAYWIAATKPLMNLRTISGFSLISERVVIIDAAS